MKVLAICGSLQARSGNLALLKTAAAMMPPGVDFVLFDGLRELPHFNPDIEASGVPESVTQWRQALAASDAVLIASPEYGFSLPGVLKNGIDWVIGSGELEQKWSPSPPPWLDHSAAGADWRPSATPCPRYARQSWAEPSRLPRARRPHLARVHSDHDAPWHIWRARSVPDHVGQPGGCPRSELSGNEVADGSRRSGGRRGNDAVLHARSRRAPRHRRAVRCRGRGLVAHGQHRPAEDLLGHPSSILLKPTQSARMRSMWIHSPIWNSRFTDIGSAGTIVLRSTRAATGCRSAWYVSRRRSGDVFLTTWASFHARFTASLHTDVEAVSARGVMHVAASPASGMDEPRKRIAAEMSGLGIH